MIKREDLGQFFTDDEGNYWQMIGWCDEPTAILKKIGTNEQHIGIPTSPYMKMKFEKLDAPKQILEEIIEQIERNK